MAGAFAQVRPPSTLENNHIHTQFRNNYPTKDAIIGQVRAARRVSTRLGLVSCGRGLRPCLLNRLPVSAQLVLHPGRIDAGPIVISQHGQTGKYENSGYYLAPIDLSENSYVSHLLL